MKILSQKFQCLVICEIKVDGCDRDITIPYSMDVRIFFVRNMELATTKPVVPFSFRVMYLLNSIVIDYLPLTCKFNPGDFILISIRHIDIQKGVGRKSLIENNSPDLSGKGRSSFEMERLRLVSAHKRNGKGWNTEYGPFYRTGNSS